MSHRRFCRATVRRAMTQRAIRPVTLATLTSDPLSRVKVARLCRRCDIGLTFPDVRELERCQTHEVTFRITQCHIGDIQQATYPVSVPL